MLSTMIVLMLMAVTDSQRPSAGFATHQLTIWQGNNITGHTNQTSPYQFLFAFPSAPPGIYLAYPMLLGFSLWNSNNFSFFANVNYANPASMILEFNPYNDLKIYSLSFTIIAVTPESATFLSLTRHTLSPVNLTNTTLTGTAPGNSESFSLTSNILISSSNFLVLPFISHFKAYHSGSPIGVTLYLENTTLNSVNFAIKAQVILGGILTEATIIVIILNIDLSNTQKHIFFQSNISKISFNFMGNPDHLFSEFSSTNFNISSIYGPCYLRNCSMGMTGFYVMTTAQQKTLLFQLAPTSFSSLVQSYTSMQITYQTFCLLDCQINGFYNSSTGQCDLCSNYIENCNICSSSTNCSDCGFNSFFDYLYNRCMCKWGDRVIGGCTMIQGCSQINKWNVCLQCASGLTLARNRLSCLCNGNLKLVTGVCIDVVGCIAAKRSNSTPICMACDQSSRLYLLNGKCMCLSGFSMPAGSSLCQPICGDGFVWQTQYCDDGNTQSGDGCSSTCQIEEHFKCVNGSLNSRSNCYYFYQNIVLKLKEIYRDESNNIGYFLFVVSPALVAMKTVFNETGAVIFQADGNYIEPKISYNNGVIQVKVDFTSDLEDRVGNLSLTFNQSLISHPSINTTFKVKSLNLPLLVYNYYPQHILCTTILQIIALMAVLLFFVGSLTHRMIGVETLHAFQIVYLSGMLEVVNKDISLRSVNALRWTFNYGDMFYSADQAREVGCFLDELMLSINFHENIWIGAILFFIGIICWVLARIRLEYFSRKRNNKIVSTFKTKVDIIYSVMVFPVVLTNLYIYLVVSHVQFLHFSIPTSYSVNINVLLIIFLIFSISLILAFDVKKSPVAHYFSYHKWYIGYYVAHCIINCFLLLLGNMYPSVIIINGSYNLIVIILIFIDLIGIIFNQMTIVLWIAMLIYKSYFEVEQSTPFIYLIIILSMLVIVSLLSFIRIYSTVYKYGWQGRAIQDGEQKFIQKTKRIADHQYEQRMKYIKFNSAQRLPFSVGKTNKLSNEVQDIKLKLREDLVRYRRQALK